MKNLAFLMLAALSMLMVSCGMSEDEFEKEYPKSLCEKGSECGDVSDVSSCRDGMKSDMELIMAFCTSFDPEKAEDCVGCVDDLSCTDWDIWQADESGESTICTECDKVCD